MTRRGGGMGGGLVLILTPFHCSHKFSPSPKSIYYGNLRTARFARYLVVRVPPPVYYGIFSSIIEGGARGRSSIKRAWWNFTMGFLK